MKVLLCVVALAGALAICIEDIIWVRTQRRQLDQSAENLHALSTSRREGRWAGLKFHVPLRYVLLKEN